MIPNEIKERELAIGLFKYESTPVEPKLFENFYLLITEWAKDVELDLTYIGAEGEGYTGRLSKFGARMRNKLTKSGFAGISVLALYSNPDGSDEPSYDRFFCASLSHVPEQSEVFLCVTVNEGIVSFGSELHQDLMRRLLSLENWSFGQSFADRIERQPDFHLMGLNNGDLSDPELKSLTRWYQSQPIDRVSKVRSVYPYNFLNETQLSQPVSEMTLRDFIENDDASQLLSTECKGVYMWKVREESVSDIRERLLSSGVLIA
jgi:hypothetical protein